MKEITTLFPEYEIGDEASFVNDIGEVCTGIVSKVTQTVEAAPRIFYELRDEKTMKYVVLPESKLLFAEVDYAKPIFSIGMKVATLEGIAGAIARISIEIEEELYYINYELDTGEIVDQDAVVYVEA